MKGFALLTVIVGCSLAMPQQRQSAAPKDNPYVKILELESYQNGADYGHALQQEDGTASGQKVAPDGLVYGFYSYIQDGGNRVKVYYRAGQGVGYEVLKVEGIDIKTLGNLKPTISKTPIEEVQPQPRQQTQVIRNVIPEPQPQPQLRVQNIQKTKPIVQLPQPVVRQQLPVQPIQQVIPILPQVNPVLPIEPTPAPHRFDYPANLNLQRTGTGFRSSFKAL